MRQYLLKSAPDQSTIQERALFLQQSDLMSMAVECVEDVIHILFLIASTVRLTQRSPSTPRKKSHLFFTFHNDAFCSTYSANSHWYLNLHPLGTQHLHCDFKTPSF